MANMARINPTAITLAIVLASLLTVHPILNHQFRHGEKIVGIAMVPRPTLFSLGARRLHPWTPVAIGRIIVAPPLTDATSTNTPDWACIRFRESSDNYLIVDPPYSGAYQALDSTWADYDGYSIAADAPPSVQNRWALITYAARGWEPWSTIWICHL